MLQLLKHYARTGNIKTSITVGLIGFPNVGKSSVINSLCRVRAAKVGATPGVTKSAQEIHLDKRVKLLDTPGIVFPKVGDVSDGTPSSPPLNAPRLLRSFFSVMSFLVPTH